MTGSVHKDLSQLKHQIILSLMLSAFDLFSDWLCHVVVETILCRCFSIEARLCCRIWPRRRICDLRENEIETIAFTVWCFPTKRRYRPNKTQVSTCTVTLFHCWPRFDIIMETLRITNEGGWNDFEWRQTMVVHFM